MNCDINNLRHKIDANGNNILSFSEFISRRFGCDIYCNLYDNDTSSQNIQVLIREKHDKVW